MNIEPTTPVSPILICGLGNPGGQYVNTPHNVGYQALDHLVAELNLAPANSPSAGKMWRGQIQETSVIAFRPNSYMNLSGPPIGKLARYFSVAPSSTVILHDEVDLPTGVLRCKLGGGNAGHKGMRSISAHFSNEVYRIRIGVGRPEESMPLSRFVLARMSPEVAVPIEQSIETLVRSISLLWTDGLGALQQAISAKPAAETRNGLRSVNKSISTDHGSGA